MSSKLSVGSKFPEGVKFTYVPYSEENSDLTACGAPLQLDVSKEVSNKRVVIVGVPGAFTPTCTENHIPPYGKELSELKKKGVDEVIVTSANDAFVLSAWGKALKLADKFKFASDPNAEFAKQTDLTLDATSKGLGIRTTRYAIVVKDGTIEYIGVEPNPGEVTVTGVDAVLSKL